MPNQLSKPAYETRDELLKNNPKISKSAVEQYHKLEEQLKKLGVDTKPRYTLSPPLGGIVSNLRNYRLRGSSN